MERELLRRMLKGARRHGLRSLSRRLGVPLLKPWWVVVDVTDRCFFRCPTCAKWRHRPRRAELSTGQWRDVLDQLAKWLGPFHVSFTGGEPLLRPDLPELISHARAKGATTNLMTNGYLIDESLATRLVAAGMDSASISLNGVSAATHDASRGYPGSFERAVQAVRLLKATGRTEVSVSAILGAGAAEEVVSLVEWASAEGIAGIGIQPLVPVAAFQPHDPAPEAGVSAPPPTSLLPAEIDDLDRAVDRLIAMKRAGYPIISSVGLLEATRAYFHHQHGAPGANCLAGFDSLLIDPYGDVRLCNAMAPLGNATRDGLPALWHSPVAGKQRLVARRCTQPCRLLNCNFGDSLFERAGQLLRRARSRRRMPDGRR